MTRRVRAAQPEYERDDREQDRGRPDGVRAREPRRRCRVSYPLLPDRTVCTARIGTDVLAQPVEVTGMTSALVWPGG